MKQILFFVVYLFIFATFSYSQQINPEDLFSEKGIIKFKFNADNKNVINSDLTKIISIDNVKYNYQTQNYQVIAYANKREFIKFLSRNINFEVVAEEETKAITMATTTAQMSSWDRYPTYSVYEQMMNNFQVNFPDKCKIDTLTTLSTGRRLLVAKISNNICTPSNKPQLLLSSTMHGDEVTGYVLMLRLANYLLSNYGTNARVTNILDNIEIYICPNANPNGTYFGGNNSLSLAMRYNGASYIDLNRNYPDPRDGDHPDGESWQPETQAFMTYAQNHHFNIAANFHGGAELINYPWDTWTSSQRVTADNSWWQYVSRQYADTAHANSSSGYMTDESNGITEGGDWFVITGGRQDYMNYRHYCREVTIELSTTKKVGSETLPSYWNYNYKSFLNFIEQSLYGIRGLVTDSCSGQSLKAKVFISGHDVDSSHVYSALPIGNYHRYLKTGAYSLTFSSPGYHSKTITSIPVTDGISTVRNVLLKKITPIPTADFTFTDSILTVNFTSTSQNAESYFWDFGDGYTSTATNPSHTFSTFGTYYVKLIVINDCVKDSITIPVILTTSVSLNYISESKTLLFPNPCGNEININIDKIDDYRVVINDLTGRVIIIKEFNGNNQKINTSSISPSIYVLSIFNSKNQIQYKNKIIKLN